VRAGLRGHGARSLGDRGRADEKELAQLAAFTVGDGWYAIDIMRIKEIIQPLPITRVPKAPSFIEGVIELRGAILPILDLRRRFDLPPTPPTRSSKYLIVAVEGIAGAGSARDRWIVGLTVDGVREVVRVPREELRATPAVAFGDGERYFSGVCHHRDKIVIVVDPDALLSPGERASLAGLGRDVARSGPPGPAKGA